MSTKNKLLDRLKMFPKDFDINELDRLMNLFHCEKRTRGMTSGSAIAYVHVPTNRTLNAHSPHPKKYLKRYQMEAVLKFLSDIGEI